MWIDWMVAALLLRITLVLALGALAARLMGRSSAASRAGVWRWTVLGVLALPVLVGSGLTLPFPVAAESIPKPWAHRSAPGSLGGSQSSGSPSDPSPEVAALESSWAVDDSAAASPLGSTADALAVESSAEVPSSPGILLLLAWALGSAVFLLRLGMGLSAARGIVRASRLCSGGDSQGSGAEVRISSSIRSPFVLDLRPLRAPVIVVPRSFAPGPGKVIADEEWMGAAMAHEDSHVTRRDGLYFLLAQTMRALLWFHPLAWWASRRLRIESERACDDAALGTGIGGPIFARALVLAASGPSVPHPVPAMASSPRRGRPGALEERIKALIDPSLQRSPSALPRRWAFGAFAGTGLVLLACASAQPAQEATVSVVKEGTQPAAGSIERSLDALVAMQDSNGAWRADAGFKLNRRWRVIAEDVPHTGATGLAVEALIRSSDAVDGPYCEAIERGSAFLLDQQDSDGYFNGEGTRMRSHAHATTAIAALHEANRSERTRKALRKAIEFGLKARSEEEGGWRFSPLTRDSDVVETAFQLDAIEAATRALLADPGVERRAELQRSVDELRANVQKRLPPLRSHGETYGYAMRMNPDVKTYVDLRSTAAGLFLEIDSLSSEATFLQGALGTMERGIERARAGGRDVSFLTMDAELLLARAAISWRATGARLGPSSLELIEADILTRLKEAQGPSGSYRMTVGPGMGYATAAACVIRVGLDPDRIRLFSVEFRGPGGAAHQFWCGSNTTAWEGLIRARDLGWWSEPGGSFEIRRGQGPGEELVLPVLMQEILQGDTTSNYLLQAGDVFVSSR